MATQPRIGSNVAGAINTHYTLLPHVAAADGYSETIAYRGGMRRMADGTVTIDLVSANAKRKFRLSWPGLTDSDKNTLVTAYAWLDDGYAQFLSPTNTTYNVNRDPDSPGMTMDSFMQGGGSLRWRVTLYLEEV
jgi:hypothetical protein